MTTPLLSTGDVCELIPEMDSNRLDRWVEAGWLRPSTGGDGSGSHRLFSPLAVVALRFAPNAGKTTWEGGLTNPGTKSPSYANLLAWFVGNHSEAELEEAFAEGRTFALWVGGDEVFRLIAPPPGVDLPTHLDLEQTKLAVMEDIEELKATATANSRRRGIVKSRR